MQRTELKYTGTKLKLDGNKNILSKYIITKRNTLKMLGNPILGQIWTNPNIKI